MLAGLKVWCCRGGIHVFGYDTISGDRPEQDKSIPVSTVTKYYSSGSLLVEMTHDYAAKLNNGVSSEHEK